MNVCIGTTPGRDLALKVNIDLEKNFLLFPFFFAADTQSENETRLKSLQPRAAL